MTTILTLAGSPSLRSRSSALLAYAAGQLQERGHAVQAIGLRDIPAVDLIEGRYTGRAAALLRQQVESARAVLISTPVYKASFAGGVKAMLDLLAERSLAGKIVLPIATGGSPSHLLALEYGLKPVLSALGARHILAGVYAADAQVLLADNGVSQIEGGLRSRLDDAVAQLADLLSLPSRASAMRPAETRKAVAFA